MPACCVCDIKLDLANSTSASLNFLYKRQWMQAPYCSDVLSKIYKNEYSICSSASSSLSPAHSVLLSRLCISPRTTVFVLRNTPYLTICKNCKRARAMPWTAIKSMPIGNEPSVLSALNAAELALVSRGRVFTHRFHIFGGPGKAIRTYHHFQTNMHCELCCILSGPFTQEQKKLAMRSVQVDPTKVIAGLSWLKANNALYADVDIPEPGDIVLPILLDKAYVVDSLEEAIEKTHVRTVCYPRRWNGAVSIQQQYLAEVVPPKNTSRLNTVRLAAAAAASCKKWTNREFLKSFPRQFPYGTGLKPYTISFKKYVAHLRALSSESYKRDPLFVAVLRAIFNR